MCLCARKLCGRFLNFSIAHLHLHKFAAQSGHSAKELLLHRVHPEDKSCVSNKNAYEFQGRSCGVRLHPVRLEENTECLLCGQYLKACDRNNPGIDGRPNPAWFKRRWFKDLLERKPFTPAQATFCLVLSGFVVYEIFTEWTVTKGLLLYLPISIGQSLGVSGAWGNGLVKSLMLLENIKPTIVMV